MLIGSAHSGAKYTYPNGSGTYLLDGANAIYNTGMRLLKVYCTPDYATTNYQLQTAWSSTPTSMTELLQTTQFVSALGHGWNTVVITGFTFANGTSNWCRATPTAAKYVAEYTELRTAAEYLLATYNGTGMTFVFQNWEGDWAFMDSFSVDTHVDPEMVDRYVAFYGARQRAIADARKAVASDCTVLCALEVNRVLDARLYPHRRRILRDLAKRVRPDMISWSSYDGTIVDQGGWGADLAAWTAATTPVMTKCLRAIASAFPGVPIQIGEIGFPEGPEKPTGRDIGAMVEVCYNIALANGVKHFIYWQVFDNEEYSPGVPRGFYIIKPDGTTSAAGAKLISLL